VDLRSHLEKMEEKFSSAKEKLGKLQDQMNAPGYKSKVDSEVKEADEERLKNLRAEVDTMDGFVASLKKLTLQES
jgi:predicted  nucleic acid-binding Zn-ribbon protein